MTRLSQQPVLLYNNNPCCPGFTIIVLPNLEPVLKVFGATKTIMPYALSYGKIMVAFSVFTMINMTMNNMIRAEGGATFSMLALSLGAIINMILDPIFIFTLNMGIEGAAIATIAGQVISTVFLLSYYFRGQCQVHLKLSKFEPTLEMYSEIFKIGIPTLLRQVLVSLSLGLINSAAMVYGDQAVAAMGVSMRVLAMSFYVTFGYLQASCQWLVTIMVLNSRKELRQRFLFPSGSQVHSIYLPASYSLSLQPLSWAPFRVTLK